MTMPVGCSTCGTDSLLWAHGDEPAGVLRPRLTGDCYWHRKLKAMENGGLPRAEFKALDLMLLQHDRTLEAEWVRWRHVAGLDQETMMQLEGRRLE